jgi:hypothetical protein
MTYFHNFIILNKDYLALYPFKVLFIIIILLQLLIIHKIFKFNLGTNYKIYNHYLNRFWVMLYIGLYIGVLFLIRYRTWGQSFDIKKLEIDVQNLYGIGILYPLTLLLLCILFFVLLYKCKQFLTKEVIKRHLYHYHMSQVNGNIRANKEKRFITNKDTPYIHWLLSFQYTYSYEKFRFYLTSILHVYTFHMRDSKKSLIRFMYKTTFGRLDRVFGVLATIKVFNYMLRILPISLLITLFTYDLYYNVYVITKIYYYLPLYLLYTVWYNISFFICNTDTTLNLIICERYYQESYVLYIGTEPKEDQFILNYIERGFKDYMVDYRYKNITSDEYLEKLEQLGKWKITFMNQHRYIRDETNMQEEYYYNEITGETLDMKLILANAK